MQRVLHVLFDERTGGPHRRILEINAGLCRAGFESLVVIPQGKTTFTDSLQAAQIPYWQLDLKRARQMRNPLVQARWLANILPGAQALASLIRKHQVKL